MYVFYQPEKIAKLNSFDPETDPIGFFRISSPLLVRISSFERKTRAKEQ